MVTTNGGPLRMPDTMVVFTPSTITVAVGETATINYSSATAPPSASTLDTLLGGIATTEVNGRGMDGTVAITGVSAGTASIAPSTSLGNGATMSRDGFALTVTAPADDQNFLNERGLAHFWDNIDSAKQDKLTAGSNITISNGTISATQPTVNDATLTIKQKDATLGTFTANASSAKTINITAPYCDGLYGQAQTASYHRSVIALCEVTTTAQSSKNSWFCGRIAFHRDNGLSGVEVVNINMENQYYKAYYTNVSYYSNFTVLGSTASKDTAIGWRPCTFKYNNVYYGGIEICTNIANHNIIWYETIGNFTPFGVDYYSMSHDSTASSVLNSEINNSISFTQWNETYNQWHVGRATRDIIYDNASGTNGNFSTTTAMSSYDEVEICYRDGNYNYALKRIPGAAGNFVLDIAHPGGSSTVQWYVSRWSVSGVNATASATCMRKAIASTSVSTTTEKDIYITRITGIRY